jgi:tRNA modification GTPase
MYQEDTIAAVATPPGEGGVAIVRISGPDAEQIAKQIFSRAGGKNGGWRSHMLHYGTVRDPRTGDLVDQVLLALMRKPRSYTGEDVVEVHCHGGPFVVRRVLELILSLGARHAEAGEFTKRAFLNGRLDLAQAEAILDLTHARTEMGMKIAVQQMRGGLSKWIEALREELLDIMAQVEAGIDFPEEDIEILHRDELIAKIESLGKKISVIVESYEWGKLYREGAKVCIAGRPNVGKSSLFNALLEEERVIVTAVPGTTRDVIEESINLGGLPVVLWDTAGIRETDNPVERAGIDFSRRHIEAADATLIVLDGSLPHTPEDESILQAVRERKGLVVVNKVDLPQRLDISWLAQVAPDKPVVSISAKHETGLEELKQAMRDSILTSPSEPAILLTNIRHKAALERTVDGLRAAANGAGTGLSPELVAAEIMEAKDGLEEIVGLIEHDDILERIFSKFCIGK